MTLLTMVVNETDIREAIKMRLDELRPVVAEYEELRGVDLALAAIPKSAHQIRAERPPVTSKRYSRGQKAAAIEEARKKGVKASSRAYGIPESTIRTWVRAA